MSYGDWATDRTFTVRSPLGVGAENMFGGALSMFRRPYDKAPKDADVAFLGVPFDQAVTDQVGCRFGPRALRAASARMTWDGGPWRWDFEPFSRLAVYDTGDLDYDHGRIDRFPAVLEARAKEIIATGANLFTMGGDHFISYPLLKAHAEKHGPLALVQFDAHSDTWADPTPEGEPKRIDHGTMFYHAVKEGIVDPARSVQTGIRSKNADTLGITTLDADFVHDHSPAEVAARIAEIVGDGPAYLTFDIDCLDPAYAPGTGTPVCGGLTTAQAERILTGLTSVDFVGMDLVEVSPAHDAGGVTALAGATMILNMLCIWASRRGERS